VHTWRLERILFCVWRLFACFARDSRRRERQMSVGHRLAKRFTATAAWAALLAAGCSGSGEATFSGRVHFNGRPVVNGAVYFVRLPDGTPLAAVIQDGQYKLTVPARGSYRVDVVGFEGVAAVASSAELAELAESGQAAPEVTEIPTDAVGNGRQIESVAGFQQLDLLLQSP